MGERRRQNRVPFRAEGFCTIGNKKKTIIITKDISLKGIGFIVFAPVEKGENFKAEIPIRINLNLGRKKIRVKGTLVWSRALSFIRRFKAGAIIKEVDADSRSYIEKYCQNNLSLSGGVV